MSFCREVASLCLPLECRLLDAHKRRMDAGEQEEVISTASPSQQHPPSSSSSSPSTSPPSASVDSGTSGPRDQRRCPAGGGKTVGTPGGSGGKQAVEENIQVRESLLITCMYCLIDMYTMKLLRNCWKLDISLVLADTVSTNFARLIWTSSLYEFCHRHITTIYLCKLYEINGDFSLTVSDNLLS